MKVSKTVGQCIWCVLIQGLAVYGAALCGITQVEESL